MTDYVIETDREVFTRVRNAPSLEEAKRCVFRGKYPMGTLGCDARVFTGIVHRTVEYKRVRSQV